MLFGDIPIVGMLKTKMRWHQERQRLLAENVANADTPGYRAKDLKAPSFPGPVANAVRGGGLAGAAPVAIGAGGAPAAAGATTSAGVQLAATNPGHLGGGPGLGNSANRARTYEVTPAGNSVVLEEQMMQIAQNVQDFQLVTQLYNRGLGLLKTATGRRA